MFYKHFGNRNINICLIEAIGIDGV